MNALVLAVLSIPCALVATTAYDDQGAVSGGALFLTVALILSSFVLLVTQ